MGQLAHSGSLEWRKRGKSQTGKHGLVGEMAVLPSPSPGTQQCCCITKYCNIVGEGTREVLFLSPTSSLPGWSDLSLGPGYSVWGNLTSCLGGAWDPCPCSRTSPLDLLTADAAALLCPTPRVNRWGVWPPPASTSPVHCWTEEAMGVSVPCEMGHSRDGSQDEYCSCWGGTGVLCLFLVLPSSWVLPAAHAAHRRLLKL